MYINNISGLCIQLLLAPIYSNGNIENLMVQQKLIGGLKKKWTVLARLR